MGNKVAKGNLSAETEEFLLRHTKFDKATIKVSGVQLIVTSTVLTVSDGQDWYSGFRAECPSGQLTREMFVSMYQQVFPRGNAEQFRNTGQEVLNHSIFLKIDRIRCSSKHLLIDKT